MRILVAEDDNDSRIVLVDILQKKGHEVVESCDGVQAWNVMRDQGIPVLLVLDTTMPGMDGLDLCRKVRAAESSSPSYIILLTEKKSNEDIVRCLQAGANDYLAKSDLLEELEARVNIGQGILQMQEAMREEIEEREKAQKQLQTAYSKLDKLVELNAEGLMVVDQEGFIREVIPTFKGFSR